MGLFANLGRRRFDRRYRAAWALMLAQYTYFTLEPTRKADVRSLIDRELSLQGAPAYENARGSMLPSWNACLMVGMHSLGIAPALEGERWPLPQGLRLHRRAQSSWSFFPPRPPRIFRIANRVALDFRIYDEATREARRDLLARGINLEEAEGDPLDDIHHYIGGGFGKPVTWREWWKSKV